MKKAPLVSVVMPVRNACGTVVDAVRSVLQQSYTNLELLVVDDGSADGSVALLKAACASDSRLRIIQTPGRGLVWALNTGLSNAKGDFVARLDADDLARPERLEQQAEVLLAQPTTGLVGCRVNAFPETLLGAGMRHYLRWQDSCLTAGDIGREIFVESPFVHSTVMFRRELTDRLGPYRQGPFPEDYELWLRWSRAGVEMTKVDRILVDWRQSQASLSRSDPRYSREAFDRLRARFLSVDRRLASGRPLVIWGAGRRTRRRCRHLLQRGHRVDAWIDIDPDKIGNVVWGAPVHAPDWLNGRDPGKRPFVLSYVANHGAAELITARLQDMDYTPGRDCLTVG